MVKEERIPSSAEGSTAVVNVDLGVGGTPVQIRSDLWLYRQVVAKVVLPEYRVTLDLVLVLSGTSYEVDAMKVGRLSGGPPVTHKLLRRLDIDGLLELVVTQVAVFAEASAMGTSDLGEHSPDVAEALNQQKRRRLITPELLAEVAEVWREVGTPKHEGVAERMHTSQRNASRWITAAKEQGYIKEDAG